MNKNLLANLLKQNNYDESQCEHYSLYMSICNDEIVGHPRYIIVKFLTNKHYDIVHLYVAGIFVSNDCKEYNKDKLTWKECKKGTKDYRYLEELLVAEYNYSDRFNYESDVERYYKDKLNDIYEYYLLPVDMLSTMSTTRQKSSALLFCKSKSEYENKLNEYITSVESLYKVLMLHSNRTPWYVTELKQ